MTILIGHNDNIFVPLRNSLSVSWRRVAWVRRDRTWQFEPRMFFNGPNGLLRHRKVPICKGPPRYTNPFWHSGRFPPDIGTAISAMKEADRKTACRIASKFVSFPPVHCYRVARPKRRHAEQRSGTTLTVHAVTERDFHGVTQGMNVQGSAMAGGFSVHFQIKALVVKCCNRDRQRPPWGRYLPVCFRHGTLECGQSRSGAPRGK